MSTPTIAEQLAAKRMRIAGPDEDGWYVIVTRADGTSGRAWATDLPGCDVDRVTSCRDYTVPEVH